MPKSRRDKVVALTQTKKKDREWKGGLIESVREALGTYASVYVFRCANLRNNTFKDLKADLRDTSRFFMGSNKVLQVALGKGPEDEQSDNLHKVSEHVKGHAGLVFTNLTKEDLESTMAKYETNDFARTGAVAPETVTIEKGPVHGAHGGLMEHTLEPTLRKNGMPTKLNRGVIELLADHVVCKEGDFISPQGAILLRLFGRELAAFKMDLLCGWVRVTRARSKASLSFVPFTERLFSFDHDRERVTRTRSAMTTTRCGWLRRLATPRGGTTVLTKSAIHFRSRTAVFFSSSRARIPVGDLDETRVIGASTTPDSDSDSDSGSEPSKKKKQSEGGVFEAYAAAEEEELDLGDVERDRFRYDHVPSSMMLPKELMGDVPVEAVLEKPKRRTSARKKAGTKL